MLNIVKQEPKAFKQVYSTQFCDLFVRGVFCSKSSNVVFYSLLLLILTTHSTLFIQHISFIYFVIWDIYEIARTILCMYSRPFRGIFLSCLHFQYSMLPLGLN